VERVRNCMKIQGLYGSDKKQRSCDCTVHRRVRTALRIRTAEGDISIPNGFAGMRRLEKQARGVGGASLGVGEGGTGLHVAR